jgi:hypothetical protein
MIQSSIMGGNDQKIINCVASTGARAIIRLRSIGDLFPVAHQRMNPWLSSLLSTGSTHGGQRAAVTDRRSTAGEHG